MKNTAPDAFTLFLRNVNIYFTDVTHMEDMRFVQFDQLPFITFSCDDMFDPLTATKSLMIMV